MHRRQQQYGSSVPPMWSPIGWLVAGMNEDRGLYRAQADIIIFDFLHQLGAHGEAQALRIWPVPALSGSQDAVADMWGLTGSPRLAKETVAPMSWRHMLAVSAAAGSLQQDISLAKRQAQRRLLPG